MTSVGRWLIFSAVVGMIGGLLPWFHPSDPSAGSGTWHAWDSTWVFLVVFGVFLLAASAGWLLLREDAGTSTSTATTVTRTLDRALWVSVAGIGALVFQWWNLPNDYVVCPGYVDPSTCGLTGTSAWIHDPGATRGVQPGWWISLLASVMVLIGMVWVYFARDRIVDILFDNRTAPTGSPISRVDQRDAVKAAQDALKRGGHGNATCANPVCECTGLLTDDSSCRSCGVPTYQVALPVPQPVVNYFPDAQAEPRTGGLSCPSTSCDEGGLRTSATTCPTCGTPTVSWT